MKDFNLSVPHFSICEMIGLDLDDVLEISCSFASPGSQYFILPVFPTVPVRYAGTISVGKY